MSPLYWRLSKLYSVVDTVVSLLRTGELTNRRLISRIALDCSVLRVPPNADPRTAARPIFFQIQLTTRRAQTKRQRFKTLNSSCL